MLEVADTSGERKTAELLLGHIEHAFKEIKANWSIQVVGFTSDASGESRKARLKLLQKYPSLVVLDCYAHQVSITTCAIIIVLI